jgi:hypothetical protein
MIVRFRCALVPIWIALPAGLLLAPLQAQNPQVAPMVLYVYKADTAANGNLVLASAGDADGDGFTDFAVGDTNSNYDGLKQNGSVRVRSGRDGSLLHEFHGQVAMAHLGRRMTAAGDLDHDGLIDLLVVGMGQDSVTGAETTARVYSGKDGSVLFEIPSDPSIGFTATSVCGARDVDGDGTADVIIGSPGAAPNGSATGAVRVYSGATHQILDTFVGLAAGEGLGGSVAAADINDDGDSDIIAGAIGAVVASGTGCARVFSGKDGTLLATLEAPAKYPPNKAIGTGYFVMAPGDLDHDGVQDVGVLIDPEGYAYVRIFSGLTGATVIDVGSGGPYNYVEAADGAGDINRDGTPDIMIGNQSGDIPSYVRIFSGADGSVLDIYENNWQCAPLGDVDGDRYVDLALGSRVVSGGPSHWKTLGFSSAGSPKPEIDAYSLMVPGESTKLALRFAKPGSLAWLVIGAGSIEQSFKGGKLFARPDLVLGPFSIDANGEVLLPGAWPVGVPSGFELVFQFLVTTTQGPPVSQYTGAMAAKQP